MYGVLQRQVDQCGEDSQERLMMSFDKAFVRERDTKLGDLYRYWNEKRLLSKELPHESFFSNQEHLPNSCRNGVAWVNAMEADPFNYTIKKDSSLSAWGNRSLRRVGELDSPMNSRSCAREYLTCLNLQQPMYHEIEQTFGDNTRHYVRLLLPILNSSNKVESLFYALRIFKGAGVSDSSSNSRAI